MSVVAALMAMLVQPPAAPSAVPPPPTDFELTCSLVGQSEARTRFVIASAGSGDGRRFAIRPEGAAGAIGEISAGSVRDGNSFHFVSGGKAYRLQLDFDGAQDPLTAKAELEEDHGFRALNLQLGAGSCRGAGRPAGARLPALPQAPEVRAEAVEGRPVSLTEGRVPSDCTIVLRDLSERRFRLDLGLAAPFAELSVGQIAGEAWPASPFTIRAALLAAVTRPPAGPSAEFLTIFAAAGRTLSAAAPAELDYELRASEGRMDGWIGVRFRDSQPQGAGAGYCRVRQEQNQEAQRRP